MTKQEEIDQLRLEAANLHDCLFYIFAAVPNRQEDMTEGHWAALQAAIKMAKDFSDHEHAPLANKEIARRLSRERK